MGTRCRGLGKILARLTGPVRGQIVTRVQITERKPSIPQNHVDGVVEVQVGRVALSRVRMRESKVARNGRAKRNVAFGRNARSRNPPDYLFVVAVAIGYSENR